VKSSQEFHEGVCHESSGKALVEVAACFGLTAHEPIHEPEKPAHTVGI
jgi:hypothetical protein